MERTWKVRRTNYLLKEHEKCFLYNNKKRTLYAFQWLFGNELPSPVLICYNSRSNSGCEVSDIIQLTFTSRYHTNERNSAIACKTFSLYTTSSQINASARARAHTQTQNQFYITIHVLGLSIQTLYL